MNRLFGTKNTAPKPSLNDAIKGIDERVGSLDVKLSKINAELSTYQQKISRMRDGPGKSSLKQKAIKLLRQRKQIEAQKDQLENQSWNMTQASMTTDNLQNTMVTINAMKTANKLLKQTRVGKPPGEMLDLIDKSNELQEALLTSYDVPEDISELELDAELEALGEEIDFENEMAESGISAPSYLNDAEPVSADKLPTFIDEQPEEAQKIAN
ncbi:Charged multivesicular body protein 5 [Candida viswanathii]|uniref:Charged multivesicular body protein 5 n=1 Tax=Candida viswanathii TaxID=5486 RepID=A0A367XYE4_9ASCO|nr:Charged multivesicular body protein 5 [Candida viswanathii]